MSGSLCRLGRLSVVRQWRLATRQWRLRGGDDGRDEVGFDGVGVDTVVEFGEGAVEVPREGEAAVLVHLEALELLDEVEFELDGDPGGEFEGDVLVGEGAAIAAGHGGEADGMRGFDPLPGSQDKAVETGPVSKPLEFEGVKIGVVQPLPNTQKLNGIAVAHPVLNDMIRAIRFLVFGNVRQADVVLSQS